MNKNKCPICSEELWDSPENLYCTECGYFKPNKTQILTVWNHGDFGAETFKQNYKIADVYDKMVEDRVTSLTLVTESGTTIFVSLQEFNYIDPTFLFLVENLMDKECRQHKDIFVV